MLLSWHCAGQVYWASHAFRSGLNLNPLGHSPWWTDWSSLFASKLHQRYWTHPAGSLAKIMSSTLVRVPQRFCSCPKTQAINTANIRKPKGGFLKRGKDYWMNFWKFSTEWKFYCALIKLSLVSFLMIFHFLKFFIQLNKNYWIVKWNEKSWDILDGNDSDPLKPFFFLDTKFLVRKFHNYH